MTGTSRSQILGPQEILGKSADYILANPNGISVNGGEFINTQSATFTTGKVLLNSKGQLEKFLTEEGDVEINGVDIDLSNLDYFKIIARSVKLNTAIYAKRDKELEDSQDTELSVVAEVPASTMLKAKNWHQNILILMYLHLLLILLNLVAYMQVKLD